MLFPTTTTALLVLGLAPTKERVFPPCHPTPQRITADPVQFRESFPPTIRHVVAHDIGARAQGVTIVWIVFGDASQDAIDALRFVSGLYAQTASDPVTVVLDITFDPDAFGGTLAQTIDIPYETLRTALITDADATDFSQAALPFGAFPARRIAGGPITSETTVSMTTANARAIGIDPGPVAADAAISVGSTLDFDASNGVGDNPSFDGEFSGLDVLIHEVAHALGFLNLIEFGGDFATPLDLYRFPQSQPDNPDSVGEFTTAPRALFVGGLEPEDEHVLDSLAGEFELSNGSETQASHFRETFALSADERTGLMEPQLAPFEDGAPFYLSRADLIALDAIGWDIDPNFASCSPADLALPFEFFDFNDVLVYLEAFHAGLPRADLAAPFGVFDLADVNQFLALYNSGCPSDD